MLKYKFQCDIFQEQVLRRPNNRCQSLLLVFGHAARTQPESAGLWYFLTWVVS